MDKPKPIVVDAVRAEIAAYKGVINSTIITDTVMFKHFENWKKNNDLVRVLFRAEVEQIVRRLMTEFEPDAQEQEELFDEFKLPEHHRSALREIGLRRLHCSSAEGHIDLLDRTTFNIARLDEAIAEYDSDIEKRLRRSTAIKEYRQMLFLEFGEWELPDEL
jgi:hypothetical protein